MGFLILLGVTIWAFTVSPIVGLLFLILLVLSSR